MLVCKDGKSDVNSDIMVDFWVASYEENIQTGEVKLIENFSGLTKIEQTTTQKYLGIIISSFGNNKANIDYINWCYEEDF